MNTQSQTHLNARRGEVVLSVTTGSETKLLTLSVQAATKLINMLPELIEAAEHGRKLTGHLSGVDIFTDTDTITFASPESTLRLSAATARQAQRHLPRYRTTAQMLLHQASPLLN